MALTPVNDRRRAADANCRRTQPGGFQGDDSTWEDFLLVGGILRRGQAEDDQPPAGEPGTVPEVAEAHCRRAQRQDSGPRLAGTEL